MNVKSYFPVFIPKDYEKLGMNTGKYDFTFTDDKNAHKVLHARFVFVYENLDGKWMIISHHSSALPE